MKIAMFVLLLFLLLALSITYGCIMRKRFHKSAKDDSLSWELNRLFEGEKSASSKSDSDTKTNEST